MGVRIVAVLIGIAVMFGFEQGFGVGRFVAFSLGLAGYVVILYVGRAISERRRLNRQMRRAQRLKREIAATLKNPTRIRHAHGD